MSNIKLTVDGDPYEYIAEMRTIVSSFENLNISIKTILQYFLWSGLNSSFQKHMVQITNKSQPLLKEIIDNVFEASQRYLRDKELNSERNNSHKEKNSVVPNSKSSSSKFQSINFATNVDINNKPNFIPCHMCVSDNKTNISHSVRNCPSYKTPREKFDKLKTLNFCTKCSFKNHSSKDCKFKFGSMCRNCNGEHMTFLCLKPFKNSNFRVNTNNVISVVENFSISVDNNIMLPTFTVGIENNNHCNIPIRALKDSGSQKNFISEKISSKLNLHNSEDHVQLKIHGFNSSKTVNTKVVRVPLSLPDGTVFIDAVVIPKINVKLTNDSLEEIVNDFSSKGYTMADKNIPSGNKDIDLILGVEFEPMLPLTQCIYGSNVKSSYYNSSLGVILSGSVRTMITNMKYLLPNNVVPNNDVTNVVPNNDVTNVVPNNDVTNVVPNNDVTNDVTNVVTDDIINCDINGIPNNCHTSMVEMCGEYTEISQNFLEMATNEAIEATAKQVLNYAECQNEGKDTEINKDLVNYVNENTRRDTDGRVIVPLMWNYKNKHLLATNFNLSKSILRSNFSKLCKNPEKLEMYDSVFKEQEENGIIERIDNLDDFMKSNEDISFLPHMGVFKMDRETTKCRVVYLSNLCEKGEGDIPTVSHNQSLLPGPNMNNKLSTTLISSRFDKHIFTFDLCKAFLNIGLEEHDQNKLLFLWYKNVQDKDYEIIAYRCKRVPFGLRSSPTLLMLVLHKILIIDTENDDEETISLKKEIYNTFYMDNGCYTCNDEEKLKLAYSKIPELFDKYQFKLQQFVSNSVELQTVIDKDYDTNTEETVKLFGMQWNRKEDTLSPVPLRLDMEASTKRQILSSINSIYDLFNIYCPMLNRAKLFFQQLQQDNTLNWDKPINKSQMNEWRNICIQANNTPLISVNRFVGERNSNFDLIAYADASATLYGVVLYIKDNNTNLVSFLCAKNKVISKSLSNKTIPTLEFEALTYATEVIIDMYNELTGSQTVIPINVKNLTVYSDSMVCISWLQSYFKNYSKMQKRSVFIMNRLQTIDNYCKAHSVKFAFIEGQYNPADFVTRTFSYKMLCKTNYFTGPLPLTDQHDNTEFQVLVDNSNDYTGAETVKEISSTAFSGTVDSTVEHLVPLDKYSTFSKLVNVYKHVMKFINILKFKAFNISLETVHNSIVTMKTAVCKLLCIEQQLQFPEVYNFLKATNKSNRDVPILVTQLNLFMDGSNLIRVRGKLLNNFPILLAQNSNLTKLIINDVHQRMSHAGLYSVLKELRKEFYIAKSFSTIRKEIKKCIICRRHNARPIKLNQNEYRKFRCEPTPIPFSSIFVDYIGPFNVKVNNVSKKLWLLIITCMWSRAVNLLVCFSADTSDFLRAIQTHIHEHGLFQNCISDLGTQIKSGGTIMSNFLNDSDTHNFLENYGINKISFNQYSKGNSSLGSLVEILVKQTKHLISKTISNAILDLPDFILLISKVKHIINRRPIAFKEGLRDDNVREVIPMPITPECLLRGRELPSLNVIPYLQNVDSNDPDFNPVNGSTSINDNFKKLNLANQRLRDLYHSEFLQQLLTQSIDKKNRFKTVKHDILKTGDIVLLEDKFSKQSNYPMGIVTKTETNSLGEVTSVEVKKGQTGETVYRHVSSLILLLPADSQNNTQIMNTDKGVQQTPNKRSKRAAAIEANLLLQALQSQQLI